MQRVNTFFLMALVFLTLTKIAFGVDCKWNVISGNWSLNSNWNPNPPGQPTSDYTAKISNRGACLINQSGEVCYDLFVDNSSTVTLNWGGSLTAGYCEYIGYNSNGWFVQNEGTNNPKNLKIAYSIGKSGTYELKGGTISAVTEAVGCYGTGNFIQDAGQNQVSQSLSIGQFAGSGTYTLNSGSLTVVNNGSIRVGEGGKGFFYQKGGTISAGSVNVGQQSTTSSFIQTSGTNTRGITKSGGLKTE